MKKNLFMSFAVILTACIFMSCSKDDDAVFNLTMNGEAINIKSLKGEYDPSSSFYFWINDWTMTEQVCFYGSLSVKLENIEIGKDLTESLSMTADIKGDRIYTYHSGSLSVQSIDTSKKILTLEFKNLKYVSSLKNEVLLNGTLAIPYKMYGED